jgi:hypothetical protein
MRRARLSLGLVLAVAAGIVLGHGWTGGNALLSSLGTMTLIVGLLTALSALLTPRRTDQRSERAPDGDTVGAPLLGQMLVSYGLITEADLERALEQQKKDKKRLGRVLVEMGLVTHAHVAEVLEEQLSRRGLGLIQDGERLRASRSSDADPLGLRVRWEGYREEPSGRDGR